METAAGWVGVGDGVCVAVGCGAVVGANVAVGSGAVIGVTVADSDPVGLQAARNKANPTTNNGMNPFILTSPSGR